MTKIWLALCLLAALGCGDSNPLLGRWTVDAEASPRGAAAGLELAGADKLEFQEGRMLIGSRSQDVTYTVEDDRVTVTSVQQGEGAVYEIVSADSISFETPVGVLIYRRAD